MKKEIKFSIDIVYPFPKKVKYIKISVYKKWIYFIFICGLPWN